MIDHPAIRIGVVVAAVLAVASAVGIGATRAGAATATLPDMQMLVLTNDISIGIDPSTGHRMLHYSHVTSDLGSGPFEIDPNYNPSTGIATFSQAIYNSPSPGHWTYDHSVQLPAVGVFDPPSDYQFPLNSFTLNARNSDGSAGTVVARSPKTDYCITGDYYVGAVANAPNQTFIPASNCDDATKPLGWSVGWGDQYDQTDDGQPIDLNSVPDGTYVLRGIVDPQHVLTESNPSNNVTDTVLSIAGNHVTVGAQTHPAIPLPSVAVTSPVSGTTVSGTVTLSASAAAASVSVKSVQFLLDGQPLGAAVTVAPYQMPWTVGSTSPGRHYLSARVTDSAGTMNTAAVVAVQVAPTISGITIEQQVSRAGTTTVSAPPISTSSPGDLLLAFVSSDGLSGQTAAVTGAGLNWSLVKRANGQPGDAEIWKATAASKLTTVTVSSTAAQAGYRQQLTIVAARAASAGNSAASSSPSAASEVHLPASGRGSIGLAVGNDYDKAVGRTVGAGQQILTQYADSTTGDTYWTQFTTGGSPGVGSTIQLNDTAPTGDHTNFAGVEMVPSGTPPPDTTPPTVAVANPVAGQTVSGTIPVAASASDNVAVKSVQFLLDGQSLGAPVTTAPYATSWSTISARNGPHTLSALATDTSNLTATSAPVTVTVQNPAPPMTCFVVQARVSAHGHNGQTSPAFHTAMPGEILLAFVASDGPTTAAQSVSVSGAGLTWRRVNRANIQAGDAEIWTATTTSVLTAATVTVTPALPGWDEDLTVVAMEGVAGIGKSAVASAPSGPPKVSVTTSGPGASLVFAVGNDWDRAVARTMPTGQILADQWVDTGVGDTYWIQYTNQAVTPPGTVVTMTDTAPTNDRWNLVGIELVGDTT